ncbi:MULTISPECIES: head GIN domain-containing protein [unclassified Lacinutrix]
MKKIVYILIVAILFSCNSEDANDCFQKSGKIVQEEVMLSSFEKILVHRDIELILKQGVTFQVVIETGENLLNDVEAKVVANELQLTDKNTCNYVRDYGITKVYVTAPNITAIRSSTQYDISSDGVLNYTHLELFSEDFNVPESFTVGDFKLQVNTQSLSVVGNNISSFYISGTTEALYVGFFSGTGRFQGEDLIAQDVEIYHRGTNDILVNPQASITGEIRSTGDVVAYHQPALVTVEEFYDGKLIFR